MTVTTSPVASESARLEAVKRLWRRDSATLGFFPDGAFSDYAQKGQVIAAERNGVLLGYTLFRRTGNRAAIVHLCVAPEARGSGVARALVSEVSRVTSDLDGLSLRCRRDFDADKLWPRLGFRPVRELEGRGKDGKPLTVWFKSHGNEDLFTFAAKQREPRIVAVIDANVFFDLAEAEERAPNESKALLADWLQDIVELQITQELFSEIRRNEDCEVRRHNLEFANQFQVLDVDVSEWTRAKAEVETLLPPPRSERDRSDRAHLAACMAAGVSHLVTRDEVLSEFGELLFERTRVTVLRPSEFIADLDEIENGEVYRPARMAGTPLRLVPAKEFPEEEVADAFRGQQRRSEFLAEFRMRIAAPRTISTRVVVVEGRPVALLSLADSDGDRLDVGWLRAAGKEARTLGSCLAHHIRGEALARRSSVVVVADAGLDASTRAAVENDEYVRVNDSWLLAACSVAGTRRDIRSWAESTKTRSSSQEVRDYLGLLESEGLFHDQTPAALIERRVWPAKVLDGTVPTYIIPIIPYWAQHLFDAELAKLDLFGAHPHLAMSRENVYYRAPLNPRSMPVPSRILWYVSADKCIPGSKAIRACSRLVEATVGPAKVVFKARRRLGIYEWRNVLDIAKKSPDGPVQALRFCDTETFASPVDLALVREILRNVGATGVNEWFPSPQRVPESVFAAIYRAGTSRGAVFSGG